MTRWTVLATGAITNVIAAVALIPALWSWDVPSTARTVALAGTAAIAAASLAILFAVFNRPRQVGYDPSGSAQDESGWPHQPPHRPNVEFRDRGDRFGPP